MAGKVDLWMLLTSSSSSSSSSPIVASCERGFLNPLNSIELNSPFLPGLCKASLWWSTSLARTTCAVPGNAAYYPASYHFPVSANVKFHSPNNPFL